MKKARKTMRTIEKAATKYEVCIYGIGLATPFPVGLQKAMEIADAQPCHATVKIWQTDQKVYDNGRRNG